MRRVRAVLDTNCYVSAFVFAHGRLTRLPSLWITERFTPVTCREILAELEDVLPRAKFQKRLPPSRRKLALANLHAYAEIFPLSNPLAPVKNLRDPKDAVFVNLARESKADFLITGDRHLLELKGTLPDVKILPPGDFLKMLEGIS